MNEDNNYSASFVKAINAMSGSATENKFFNQNDFKQIIEIFEQQSNFSNQLFSPSVKGVLPKIASLDSKIEHSKEFVSSLPATIETKEAENNKEDMFSKFTSSNSSSASEHVSSTALLGK